MSDGAVRVRRRFLLLVYAAVLIIIISATITAVCIVFSRHGVTSTDRIAAVGVVVAGSTLLLAFVAALIALQAYAAATGLPSLKIQLQFNYSDRNIPIFRASYAVDG